MNDPSNLLNRPEVPLKNTIHYKSSKAAEIVDTGATLVPSIHNLAIKSDIIFSMTFDNQNRRDTVDILV
ncbi:hypothetical protein HDU76_000493 [Blyttiomyces sp. JEL0837]|nr:hypothetical protein HDU76_000493 [Blyttiomyces sp. JEL0837]